MTDYSKRRLLGYLGGAAFVLIAVLVGCWLCYDWHMVEKILTKLLLPSGLIWLALSTSSLVAWSQQRRGWAVTLTALFAVYWTATAGLAANWAMGTLESRYSYVDLETVEPFDVIIVLGGATTSDYDGNVSISDGGDRLMLAGRLYHRGKVKRLITTGQSYDWSENVDMSEAAFRIWTDLGIPAEAIEKIGGHNTSEEMKNIKQLLGDEWPSRVGLLTSAFHLPRAERLAKAAGLTVLPVPSDFYTIMRDPWPLELAPSHHALKLWNLTAKEYLARLLSR